MLSLTLGLRQGLTIRHNGEECRIVFIGRRSHGRVKIGIDAPLEFDVTRDTAHDKTRKERTNDADSM